MGARLCPGQYDRPFLLPSAVATSFRRSARHRRLRPFLHPSLAASATRRRSLTTDSTNRTAHQTPHIPTLFMVPDTDKPFATPALQAGDERFSQHRDIADATVFLLSRYHPD